MADPTLDSIEKQEVSEGDFYSELQGVLVDCQFLFKDQAKALKSPSSLSAVEGADGLKVNERGDVIDTSPIPMDWNEKFALNTMAIYLDSVDRLGRRPGEGVMTYKRVEAEDMNAEQIFDVRSLLAEMIGGALSEAVLDQRGISPEDRQEIRRLDAEANTEEELERARELRLPYEEITFPILVPKHLQHILKDPNIYKNLFASAARIYEGSANYKESIGDAHGAKLDRDWIQPIKDVMNPKMLEKIIE